MIKASKLRKSRRLQRQRRHSRIRKRVYGTETRPRLAVYRSLRNVEGQIIDDDSGKTLIGLSTLSPDLRGKETEEGRRKVEEARAVGKLLGTRAVEQGVKKVVFDRGGFRYHGRVRAFAEGAREGGLEF